VSTTEERDWPSYDFGIYGPLDRLLEIAGGLRHGEQRLIEPPYDPDTEMTPATVAEWRKRLS
jgi:hypothetical protein